MKKIKQKSNKVARLEQRIAFLEGRLSAAPPMQVIHQHIPAPYTSQEPPKPQRIHPFRPMAAAKIEDFPKMPHQDIGAAKMPQTVGIHINGHACHIPLQETTSYL